MTISDLSAALDAIELQKPGAVHAGRPGVVIGYRPLDAKKCPQTGRRLPSKERRTLLFRRLDGAIFAEEWQYARTGIRVERIPLPSKLVARCARLLDR